MKNKYHLCFCSREKLLRFFNRPVLLFFFLFLLCFRASIQAQNTVAEKEAQQRLEKTASDYFEQQDLVNAYPLYSHLLSIYPHDPNYNYRLGACMLYASANKKKAIKYIQYALKQTGVENLAFYYMGRAFHLNYEFDEAIQFYQKFEEAASSGELKKYPVKHLIEMCQNGKELLATTQELDVLRKKELNFSIFHEAYTMRSNGGTLISEPEEFKTKIDKKNKVVNLMYLTPGRKEAFFSSYGNNEDNGKDIYVIKKKADGTWGEAINLGTVINTSFDEDYPVYDEPRNTLYFASKGHNSMGGYDIFSSVYNDTTETWSEPYNLDFPINTPDDDILLVPDTSGQIAFFASARSSPLGKINVYKIALHLSPPGTMVVAGTVHKAGGDAAAYSIITVRDSATNKVIAVDTTSAQDGNYSFNLFKGGKYIFTVEDSTHKSQSKTIALANSDAQTAIEQNIQYDASGTLQINNHLADKSENANPRLALQYIQNVAKMEVNVDTNSIQTLLAQKGSVKSNTLSASSSAKNNKKQNALSVSAPQAQSADGSVNNGADVNSNKVVANNSDNSGSVASSPQSQPSDGSVNNPSVVSSGKVAVNDGDNSGSDASSPQAQSADGSVNNPSDVNSGKVAANNSDNSGSVASSPQAQPADIVNKRNDINSNKVSEKSNLNATPGSTDSLKVVQLAQGQQELNDKAAGAIDYANNEMEQARQLREKANNISHRENGKNKSDSVAILSNEANEAEEKGMEAYQLASKYKSGAAVKQVEISRIGNASYSGDTAEKTSTNAQSSSGDENNTTPTTGASVKPGDIIRQQAAQVKDDSLQLAKENIEESQEVSELQQKSADFVTQAGQTTDAQQKVALLQQADDLSKSKAEKQNEINDNNTQLQQLHDEYAWLSGKARQADSISEASSDNNGTNSNLIPQIALQKEIDKYMGSDGGVDSSKHTASNDSLGSGVAANENLNHTDDNKHSKHPHKKKSKEQLEEQDNAIASNPPVADVNAPDNNTQTAVVVQNNDNGSSVTGNSGNSQEVQTNNISATSIKDSSETNNVSAGVIYPTTVASNSSSVNKHVDSSVYYKAPNNIQLDSLANAVPISGNSLGGDSRQPDEQNSSSISAIKYTDTSATGLSQKSQNYFAAASQWRDTLQNIRNEAKLEKDKNLSAVLYKKADSVDALVYQLNLKGDEIIAEGNARQYGINADRIKGITSESSSGGSDKIAIAQLKLKDAQDSYMKYLWEKDSANSTLVPARKQSFMESAKKDLSVAILKQQIALYLYFQADSAQNSTNPIAQTSDNVTHTTYDNAANSQPDAPQSRVVDNNEPAKAETNNDAGNIRQSSPVKETAQDDVDASSPKQNNEQPAPANNDIKDVASAPEEKPTAKNIASSSSPETEIAKPAPNSENSSSIVPGGEGIVFKDVNTRTNTTSVVETHMAKPIPVDPPIASGLIFGVQVGAFRNPISPGLFSSFEPVMGMKTPEGLVRYIAGKFKAFDAAKDAARKIRNMGYQGAFVVAFYNGKRITIKDALAMLGISPNAPSAETQPVANIEKQEPSQSGSTETSSQTIPNEASSQGVSNSSSPVQNEKIALSGNTILPSKKELIDRKRKDSKAIKDSVPPEADAMSEVKGLVYTVQVGSFSKRKGYSRLQKIKHLYYWADVDGTVKYNSGTYSNVADARAAKDIIVANTLVKDAFVTAYYKGKRITPAQATSLLSSGVEPDASVTNVNKTDNAPVHPTENAQPANEKTDNGQFTAASRTNVIYTVKIASFKGKLPVDTVNKLLSYANEGIQPHDEGQGITTYYAGALPDYESAQALQQKFFNGGFPRAVVEAFYHGKKISIQEAQTIKNQ